MSLPMAVKSLDPAKAPGEKTPRDPMRDGFIPDPLEFYEAGPFERKDDWGGTVSHQDSRSFPGCRGRGVDTV